jgi:hypothetical protein
MFLTRLVYTSTVTDYFSPKDVESILTKARESNGKMSVTGMLCFHRKYFLQSLEGSRKNVNIIYHKILNDRRHDKITMLDYKEINVREFSDWSMAYVPESNLTKTANLMYSRTSEFKPYEMSGESAWKMMVTLKKSLPSI